MEFPSPLATSLIDGYDADPLFLASQEELRALLFDTARSTAQTRAPTPEHQQFVGTVVNHGGTTGSVMYSIINSPRRFEYLQNYINEIAPWLDMFDSKRAFGTVLLDYAQHSEALLYAILALSARQIERKQRTKESFESLELYSQSIRLFAALLPSRDAEVIAIAVILCCLEMMSASALDWRRHLEGCASLFAACNLNGFSGGMNQALFWCYARMGMYRHLI
jgi:hypothetical protein